MTIKNGVIETTRLGIENGNFVLKILVRYNEHQNQLYGIFDLYREGKPTAYGLACVNRMLEVIGVGYWEELGGQPVRVEATDECVKRVGNYLDEVWFDEVSLVEEFEGAPDEEN